MQRMFSEFCDAHVHLTRCGGLDAVLGRPGYRACCSLHTEEDAALFGQIVAPRAGGRVLASFGVLPQRPDIALLPALECLAGSARIAAVGECGFDYRSPEYTARKAEQEAVWQAQLGIAVACGLPVVVHAVRAVHRLFEYAAQLRRLPAVIMHSFSGSPAEAQALLRRGVNAYFSFGIPLLRGSRRAEACALGLPAGRILLETDAPYQTLRGEAQALPSGIGLVYARMHALLGLDSPSAREDFRASVCRSFCAAYGAEPPA